MVTSHSSFRGTPRQPTRPVVGQLVPRAPPYFEHPSHREASCNGFCAFDGGTGGHATTYFRTYRSVA